MSSVSTLAKFRPQRGWFHQRYKEPLSLTAFDGHILKSIAQDIGISSGRACQINSGRLQYNHLQRASSPSLSALPTIQYP